MQATFWIPALAVFLSLPRPAPSRGTTPATPAGADSIPEPAYLDLVVERNSELQALRQEVEARRFAIRAEMSVRRPSLALAAEESRWLHHDRGDRWLDLAGAKRFDLLGRYGLQEQELLLGLEILRCQYAHAANQLRARAGSAYRRAVIAGLNQRAMERILHQRQESLLVTREKAAMELVPLLDLLRAESQVDDGEAFLLQAQQSYAQQLVEMAALAGQATVVPVLEIPPLAAQPLRVDPEEAWVLRPDLVGLVLAGERAAIQRSLAARGLAPVLDLTASLRLAESYRFPAMEGQQGKVHARAVVTVPLVDGGQTTNARRAAAHLVHKADSEIQAQRDHLQREVDLVRERWQRGLALEVIRRRQAARAARELEIAEMMYREGLVAQLELISAQEADQRSRSEHLATLQELWLVLGEADRVMARYPSPATD